MAAMNLNSGALAPVVNEVDCGDLPVTGTIPRDPNGLLVRNGPNPLGGRFEGNDMPLDWWPEAAMFHGISFQDGRVTGYRNRLLDGQGTPNIFILDGTANHHIPVKDWRKAEKDFLDARLSDSFRSPRH